MHYNLFGMRLEQIFFNNTIINYVSSGHTSVHVNVAHEFLNLTSLKKKLKNFAGLVASYNRKLMQRTSILHLHAAFQFF
jgi:hypothetical protein